MTRDRDQKKKTGAPAGDPVAERIRARRTELGWSLAELAEEAGLRAPSYVFHIEAGEKIPSEDVARRLADALGEDREVFQAWARLRGRSDLRSALSAARTLDQRLADRAIRRIVADPAHEVSFGRADIPRLDWPQGRRPLYPRMPSPDADALYESREDIPLPDALDVPGFFAAEGDWAPSRAGPEDPVPAPRIELLAEGADPDDPGHPRVDEPRAAAASRRKGKTGGPAGRPGAAQLCFQPGVLEAHPKVAERLRSLDRPFAYRLNRSNTARTEGFLPPRHFAVLSRDVLPLDPREAYAVRTGRGVELGQLRWDGERLLLLPSPGKNDFQVFSAPSEAELLRLIAGKVEVLIPVEAVRGG